MATEGFTDWRGRPIDKKKNGGVKAAFFIHFMVVMTNIANVPMVMNLVSYVHGTMHAGVAKSSTIVTNFIGATCAFSLLGAFLSDSYIKRIMIILMFAPLEFLGYGFLALQAHLPSLRPPLCDVNVQANGCKVVSGWNAGLLYVALGTAALGEGCIRACLPSLGGDQFDDGDPAELRQKSSFFNWFTFDISVGSLVGLILIVWVENNKGWDLGFGLCALSFLLGLLVLTAGFPRYRNQVPKGSPLTRILQVLVAAFRKRKLKLPENAEDLYQIEKKDTVDVEVLSHTKGLRFLDRASILVGDSGPWSLCPVTQVEETKIVLRMLPLLISSIVGCTPNTLLLTFTVQQGSTMNTRLGKIHMSPASLFVIPVIFQMVILVIYDRWVVPLLRRLTGYVGGITHLQRIGIGFASTALATCAAALVEGKRLRVAREVGAQDVAAVPMSMFWLVAQFFFLGIFDVTAFVGLLEFFNGEASRGMKSIGTSLFWCILGLAAFLATFVVDAANKVTRHGNGADEGWLEGSNLNRSRLDLFYWFLCVLQLVAFFNFVFWAKGYIYRHNPRIQV